MPVVEEIIKTEAVPVIDAEINRASFNLTV